MEPIAKKIKEYLEALGFIKGKTQVDVIYEQDENGTVKIQPDGTVNTTINIIGKRRTI